MIKKKYHDPILTYDRVAPALINQYPYPFYFIFFNKYNYLPTIQYGNYIHLVKLQFYIG